MQSCFIKYQHAFVCVLCVRCSTRRWRFEAGEAGCMAQLDTARRQLANESMLIGQVDGIFGEGSSEALRMFQAQVGRPASGAGDITTLKMLYAKDAPINPVQLETPTPGPGELWEESALIPSE